MERNILNNSHAKAHLTSGIAYISRSQMVLYIQGMVSIVTLPFPADAISDLDVTSQAKLNAFITSVISQQKLPLASLTLLLANDLLFAKQMMNNELTAQKLEEQAFVDMVPYEEVGVQKVPFNNGIYITVANKDFYEGVIKSFEINNFSVHAVLAAYIFSKEVNFAYPLTPQGMTLLMQKSGNFKQYNFCKKR